MSGGVPTQIPLGELTVLPRLPADPNPALGRSALRASKQFASSNMYP